MAKRECLLCHTTYNYCPYCEKDKDKPRWMIMLHDENCHKIFDTLQRNYTHEDSDEVSIAKLKSCDMSVLKNATNAVQEQVKNILAKEVKTETKQEETPVENKATDTTKEAVKMQPKATVVKRDKKRIVKEN